MVTGVEVAGLALGSFPILVEGLKAFHSGIGTIKNMRRSNFEVILRRFLREVEVHSWTYTNTCKLLLDGVVSSEKLGELLSNPEAADWGSPELQGALESRLPPAAAKRFIITVSQLVDALAQMRKLLGINEADMV